jgi:hypothetical protein
MSNLYSTSCHTCCSISTVTCSAASLILALKLIQVLNSVMSHHNINAIHYIAPKQKIKWSQIRVPRWAKKLTNPAKQSSRKCSTKNFHNLSWGMWHWAILLVATHETITIEECTVLCIWTLSLLKPHHYFSYTAYTNFPFSPPWHVHCHLTRFWYVIKQPTIFTFHLSSFTTETY